MVRVRRIRAWASVASAAVLAATAVGFAAGSAQAAPGCPDVHWIGVAGSGERDDPTVDAGMGRVVYNSLQDLGRWMQQDGRTMTAEAVVYPAAPVPADGDLLGWGGFMSSVDAGVAALGNQYAAFTQQCPDSKVVLAGYSQGAMVVHRNLAPLAGSPNLAAALLVADGDRLPADPTVNLGTATASTRKGVAQDWPILAHAPAPLTPAIGSRTISVCDRGDAVCDYDEDADEVTATAIAVHTSYARSSSGGYRWTWPLYRMLGPSPVQQQTVPVSGSTDGVVHS